MSIEKQTVTEKEAQIISDVQTETEQQIPPLSVSWDRIWARTFGGLLVLFDRAIGKALKNVFLSSTQNDDILTEYSTWTDTPRGTKTQSKLNVRGTGTAGATIPGGLSGDTFVSEDGQKFYFESSFVIPSTGIVSEVITAMIAGPQGNIRSGELYITAQDPNISGTLTINEADPVATEGKDEEDREKWRTEMKRVAQRPVLSDNYSYFYSTARQTPGQEITAGYPYVGRPGQLFLFVRTDSDTGEATTAQVTAVQEYFDGTSDGVVKLPTGYDGNLPDSATEKRFNVSSVATKSFRVRVYGLQPGTDDNKQIIADDIGLMFEEREPYIKGVTAFDKSSISVSSLTTRIQNKTEITGMTGFVSVQFSLDGTFYFLSQYVLGRGEVAYIDTDLDNGKIEFL